MTAAQELDKICNKIFNKVVERERNLGQYASSELHVSEFMKEAYMEGYANGFADASNKQEPQSPDGVNAP